MTSRYWPFADNAPSLAVSRKLGYVDDGIEIRSRRGLPATLVRLRLSREAWLARRGDTATVTGLDGVSELLGARGP
ncbi:MAG: hypothetical protein QOK42_925 [Frankiaceae bacterium]|jgi:hypothetical protein|nr:hypothetical protein [Frankiaceae bacterium]